MIVLVHMRNPFVAVVTGMLLDCGNTWLNMMIVTSGHHCVCVGIRASDAEFIEPPPQLLNYSLQLLS